MFNKMFFKSFLLVLMITFMSCNQIVDLKELAKQYDDYMEKKKGEMTDVLTVNGVVPRGGAATIYWTYTSTDFDSVWIYYGESDNLTQSVNINKSPKFTIENLTNYVEYTFEVRIMNSENEILASKRTTVIPVSFMLIQFDTDGSNQAKKTHSTKVVVANATSQEYMWTNSSASPLTGTWTSFNSGDTISIDSVNGNYYLHVKAKDGAGETIKSTNAFLLDNSISSVTGLKAVSAETSVKLSWTNPSDSDFSYCRVSYGLNSANLVDYPDNITQSTIDITNLVSSTNYTFKVVAVDTLGNISSDVTLTQSTLNSQGTQTSDPQIINESGTLDIESEFTLTCSTSGARIYYTTDNSNPTTSSKLYNGGFTLEEEYAAIGNNITIKAIAVSDEYSGSNIISKTFTISPLSTFKIYYYTENANPHIFLWDNVSSEELYGSWPSRPSMTSLSGNWYYFEDSNNKFDGLNTVGIVFEDSGVDLILDLTAFSDKSVWYKAVWENTRDEAEKIYSVNPNNQVGKYSSSMHVESNSNMSEGFSDWSEDMLIAQGVANDEARCFRGGHEFPLLDTYSLYAAWDDSNLYLGWQFVYVNDVVDPANAVTSGMKPYNNDIPQMIVFDIDSSKAGTGEQTDGGDPWSSTRYKRFDLSMGVDTVAMFSSRSNAGSPSLFYINNDNKFSYNSGEMESFDSLGVVYGAVDGLLSFKVYGIDANSSDSGYTPASLQENTGWVNMIAEGHDSTYDTFYEMKIPFAALGINRSFLENTGIGVMHISISGTASAVASIPFDTETLNVAEDPGTDESTSKEKEDVDNFTSPLARVGKL